VTSQRLHRIARETVDQALARLPAAIRAAAMECSVELLDEPDARQLAEGVDADLLGLFEGASRLEPPPEGPADVPRVSLFLENIWWDCGEDINVFREEVRITLLHELGHYLGFDEEQVAELGLE
jgi:predicted Zn-dependent protease with MMP-like domain